MKPRDFDAAQASTMGHIGSELQRLSVHQVYILFNH